MAAGLQVFDASGNIILDATYRVMRIIGGFGIGSGNPSGSIGDARLSQGGWVSFQPAVMGGAGYLSGGMLMPTFSISGSTLSWSYPPVNSAQYDTWQSGILFYGAS